MSRDRPYAAPPRETMPRHWAEVSGVLVAQSARFAGGTPTRTDACAPPRASSPWHGAGASAVDEPRHYVRLLGHHVRPREIEHHEIRLLAGLDRADLGVEPERPRAAERGELQRPGGGECVGAEARLLNQRGEPHLL